jgi:hypothetical protein
MDNIIEPNDNFDFSNTVYEKNSNKFLISTTFFNDADSYDFINGRWLLNSGDENDPRVSNHVEMNPSFGFGVHNILTNNFLRIKNTENNKELYHTIFNIIIYSFCCKFIHIISFNKTW